MDEIGGAIAFLLMAARCFRFHARPHLLIRVKPANFASRNSIAIPQELSGVVFRFVAKIKEESIWTWQMIFLKWT